MNNLLSVPPIKGMILNAILRERERQDEKWGIQNHPRADWLAILAEELGECAAHCCPFSPDDKRALASELVQVAAVAIAWLEDLAIAYAGPEATTDTPAPPASTDPHP